MKQGFSTVSVEECFQQKILELGEQLRQRGWTLSCAESCTGGGVAFTLTSVVGSSDWFQQSWVTYSNDAKQQLIGVASGTLEKYGAVSEQVVTEMAAGVVQRSGAQLGIAVSGVAGPGGGSADKPVGTVWFGFAMHGRVQAVKQFFKGDRQQVRSQSVVFAIEFLNKWLVEYH
ncbi:CinA family protein [Alteromonas pelagimontana]|uniref:CinA family protein n=1 Tax=Alteromonas pelagimontana TaxID=1858656 RepID=A0A6M4MF53_9ALTE|nr:CinA family protein [Alteromonas pelagimontana]QJR81729.1 CinA family protein [Alteromonas pelagimontana]